MCTLNKPGFMKGKIMKLNITIDKKKLHMVGEKVRSERNNVHITSSQIIDFALDHLLEIKGGVND